MFSYSRVQMGRVATKHANMTEHWSGEEIVDGLFNMRVLITPLVPPLGGPDGWVGITYRSVGDR